MGELRARGPASFGNVVFGFAPFPRRAATAAPVGGEPASSRPRAGDRPGRSPASTARLPRRRRFVPSTNEAPEGPD